MWQFYIPLVAANLNGGLNYITYYFADVFIQSDTYKVMQIKVIQQTNHTS